MFFIPCIPFGYTIKIPDVWCKTQLGGIGFSKHAYKHIRVGSFGPSLALNGFEKPIPPSRAPDIKRGILFVLISAG